MGGPPSRTMTGFADGATVKGLVDWYQIASRKARLLEGASGLFVSGVERADAGPVDLTVLHAKIGELTLEKDVLAGALSEASLLSAKRRSTADTNFRPGGRRTS